MKTFSFVEVSIFGWACSRAWRWHRKRKGAISGAEICTEKFWILRRRRSVVYLKIRIRILSIMPFPHLPRLTFRTNGTRRLYCLLISDIIVIFLCKFLWPLVVSHYLHGTRNYTWNVEILYWGGSTPGSIKIFYGVVWYRWRFWRPIGWYWKSSTLVLFMRSSFVAHFDMLCCIQNTLFPILFLLCFRNQVYWQEEKSN